MARKAILLCTTVALFAASVPALASAAPTMTVGGSAVKVNETITATGVDIIFTSSTVGDITCGQLNLGAQVTKNDDTNGVAMKSINQFTSGSCTNKNGTVDITKLEIPFITANVSGSITISFTAEIDLGKLTCTFTGTSVPGGYKSGSDTITFSGATGIVGGACGTAKLDGSFTLELGSTPALLS